MKMKSMFLGLGAAIVLSSMPTLAQAKTRLIVNCFWPPQHFVCQVVLPGWLEEVEKVTEGRVVGNIPPKSVAPPPEQLGSVEKGIVDAERLLKNVVVNNKIELPDFQPIVDVDEEGDSWRVWVSAQKNLGIELLLDILKSRFFDETANYHLSLSANEGQIRALLFEHSAIDEEVYEDNGDISLKLRLSPTLLKRLTRKYGVAEERFTIQLDTLAGVA